MFENLNGLPVKSSMVMTSIGQNLGILIKAFMISLRKGFILSYKEIGESTEKKGRLLCNLTFLLRCRDTKTIPKFLRMKRIYFTNQASRIYQRTENAMLRVRIQNTRRELAFNDKELLSLHLRISNHLTNSDWNKIDEITYDRLLKTMEMDSNRLKEKFSKISVSQKETHNNRFIERTVVNLTDRVLTEEETSVLAKGGNFAVTPSFVPVEDIIANVESGIRGLPEHESEEIRGEVARILRKAKKPVSNLPAKERNALKSLNSDKDIIILPADKGNATVIMSTAVYEQNIQELLDPNTYKIVNKDPNGRILWLANKLIKESSIDGVNKKCLCKSEALPPRLYGLPKIHKDQTPLRPIVSAIGSPTYELAKYLASLLKPHIGRTDTYVKDSTHFIEQLKAIKLQTDDRLVSFDVVSLFTKVPVSDTLRLLEELFPCDIIALFRVCLTESYFLWKGQFYE